jgi:uncharacterized membrane protein
LDSSVIALLTGSGGAAAVLGAVLVCFMTGFIYPKSVVDDKDEEIAALKQTIASDRMQNDASRSILMAVQAGIAMSHQQAGGGTAPPGGPG